MNSKNMASRCVFRFLQPKNNPQIYPCASQLLGFEIQHKTPTIKKNMLIPKAHYGGRRTATSLPGADIEPEPMDYVKEEEKKVIFKPDTSKFSEIVEMEGFIDHTMVIKKFLKKPRKKFVLAPPRFGKSTNINTIHSFLEIEVDTTGKPIRDISKKAAGVDELLKGSKNYQLFRVPKVGCQILNDEELVLEHFGRYPVIKLDFAVRRIRSLEEAINRCLEVVHLEYVRHEYLERSPMLNQHEKETFKIYRRLDELLEENVDTKFSEVIDALRCLAKFLQSHFSRKIVLLIDEFDAIISSAKFFVDSNELVDILNFIGMMLHRFWKGSFSHDHVEYIFITGIGSMGCPFGMTGFAKYEFLDDEDFIGLHGVEKNEIEKLVTRLKGKDLLHKSLKEESKIMEVINENYNGYYGPGSESKSIFPLWSVLHYLQNGIAKSHWPMPSSMTYIKGCLKHAHTSAVLLRLTGKKAGEETVDVRMLQHYDNILELRANIGLETTILGPDIDIMMSYLKELGYLCNVRDSAERNDYYPLKIANEEMRKELLSSLMRCDKIVGFDFTIMRSVDNIFRKIFHSPLETQNLESLNNWYQILKQLFEGFDGFNKFRGHYINESVVMSVLNIALSKLHKWERYSSDNRIKDDEGNDLISGGSDNIWMRLKDPMTGKLFLIIIGIKDLGLQKYPLIIQRERLSFYALSEIVDSENEKGYFSAIEKLKPDEYVCMGVSLDHSTNKPSICVLKNTRDVSKAVCLSETEWKYYDSYDGPKPLKPTTEMDHQTSV